MRRIIITTLVAVILSGCTNILRKKITLLDTISHSKVIYQDETISISFSKNELVQETYNDISQDTIVKDKVLELISIQEDILLPTDIGELYNSPDSLKRLAYAVFDKAHIKLLKSGHASVYNKLEKKYENKIFYYKNRNKLGNTSTFFCFPNGKVFYSNLIAFGE